MRIVDFLKPGSVVASLQGTTKDAVLKELAQVLAASATGVTSDRVYQVLSEREKVGSTGMEKGVAIPHARLPDLPGLVACFGVSHAGVNFEARDERPTQFLFALVAPENSAGVHLKALSKISRLFRSEALRAAILEARTGPEIYALIEAEDTRS